jgi:type II secretory pathway pseudopilin PulG
MVEMIIATTVLAIFLSALGLAAVRSSDAYEEGAAAAELNAGLNRALEVIVREFEDVVRSELDPQPLAPNGADSVDFRVATGYADDAILWGNERRIAWEIEPGEVDDGLDNDGDGLIDEGRVVWTEDPDTLDAMRRVLIGGVRELDEGEIANGLDDDGDGLIDERGFALVLQGDVLRIRLCIEGVDLRGTVHVRIAETSVHVRNDGTEE